ncbi:MAG: GNAT family N-acetyltransferase [Candidatus Bathyarchaeia archaeon]
MNETVDLNDKASAESLLARMIEEALNAFHRRLVVISGESSSHVLSFLILKHRALKMLRGMGEDSVVYVDHYSDGGERFKMLMDVLESFGVSRECIKHYSYEESHRALGTTNDILIMDMSAGARPNDIGRLVETVRGGGLVILYNLDLKVDKPWETSIHRNLLYSLRPQKSLNKRFEEFFIKKLFETRGVWILNDWKVLKGELLNPPKVIRERPKIPEKVKVLRKLYELSLTEDQAKALQIIEETIGRERQRKSALLITSNRGRGKSALLGLSAAMLLYLGARKIIVTAPNSEESQIVFGMIEKGLEVLNESFVKEIREGMPKIKCRRGSVEFDLPQRALRESADVLMVDEAAGIPVPLLFTFTEKFPKVIFASTVHGYEGAGRGFSLRFLKALQQNKEINLQKIEIKEPIRYAPNDPVEKWLYDALLLDAEPADIDEIAIKEIKPEECRYEKVDLDSWFKFDEKRLREFIGIYVLAHYRNRPDDLLILGDAPHHSARAVIAKSGETIAALHIAEEGDMTSESIDLVLSGNPPPGNLIPSCIIKYYPLYSEFARLKGIRIVRVAVHPELIGKGIGSLAIKNLCDEANSEGFDWVGASFGADRILLNFWLKNGFIPVHISPMRNVVSGEYSVAVVKPLSERAETLTREIYVEFKVRLLNSLPDTYFSLEPEVAVQLLSVNRWDSLEKPSLSQSQKERLLSYVKGSLSYEGACDAVKQILMAHFLSSGKPRLPLNLIDEIKLVARCLQCRSWDRVANIVKTNPVDLKYEVRAHVGALMKYYL